MGSLNEDEEGVPCPVCAERLLETLPGVFHAPWGERRSDETEAAPSTGAFAASDGDAPDEPPSGPRRIS